jgi:hypothetical protein
MNPDEFKQVWQSQTSEAQLTIDADLLLQEVRRNQQHFAACILWRDVREIGVAILMLPLWLFLGHTLALPWTWYLMMPMLVWIAGFMLMDRLRHQRRPPEPADPLRKCVQHSLAQVEHQIWLLGNVLWWYILPPAVAALAFFAQVAWHTRSLGWLAAFNMAFVVTVACAILAFIYWINQLAVRQLVSRRDELAALLASLQDETPAVG